MLANMEQICETNAEMDLVPKDEEIFEHMDKTKESSAGPDEITITMLKKGGEKVRQKVASTVKKMWITEPEEWEEVMHEADVIVLFKKGDRGDLDNYRGICLLQTISRLVARIAARRLSNHL
jgi:hypothetical protein